MAIKISSIRLDSEEIKLGAIEEEELAGRKTNRWLRAAMTSVMAALFIGLNGVVIWLIYYAMQMDAYMIANGDIQSTERLITDRVFLALIAGTVAQLGGMMYVITQYLFPKT